MSGSLDYGALDKEIKELEKKYDREQGTEEGQLYNKLNSIATLQDEEVKPLLDKLLQYIQADRYNIYDLLYIYTLLLKYNYWHIVGFELNSEIDNMIIASMQRQKDRHLYNSMFEYKTPIWDNSAECRKEYDMYNAIKNVARDINTKAKVADEASGCQQFIDAAERGDVRALQHYRINQDNRISVNGMDWEKVKVLLQTVPNQVACELCECIIFLIPDPSMVSEREKENIEDKLIPALGDYLKASPGRPRDIYVSELLQHLKSVVKR